MTARADLADHYMSTAARHAALIDYAESLEARIALGDDDGDLVAEARAARAAALALEAE